MHEARIRPETAPQKPREAVPLVETPSYEIRVFSGLFDVKVDVVRMVHTNRRAGATAESIYSESIDHGVWKDLGLGLLVEPVGVLFDALAEDITRSR